MIINRQYDLDPPFEIIEKEDGIYFCKLEVPNLKEESLKAKILRMEDGRVLLKIKGEKVRDIKIEDKDHKMLLESTCIYGKFKKMIEIGINFDIYEFPNKITSSNCYFRTGKCKDGVAIIEYKKLKKPNTFKFK